MNERNGKKPKQHILYLNIKSDWMSEFMKTFAHDKLYKYAF